VGLRQLYSRAAGAGICLLMSAGALYISGLHWNARVQLSALTIAIVAGIVVAHARVDRVLRPLTPGIRFSQQTLLRGGIVLYGIRLTLSDLRSLGPTAFLIDMVVIGVVLSAGYWLGTRAFRLDPDTALLISAGSGICGAAAVLATDRVIESESHKVSIAVATVVLFGTAAMFLYPALYPFTGFTPRQFGVFAGSTIHEVAQVVAAGRAVGPATADVAVVTKMLRVVMLAPVLVIIAYLRRKRSARAEGAAQSSQAISIPWFVLGFGAVMCLNSMVSIPATTRAALLTVDTILLGSAMFALGLGTRWKDFKKTGPRPMLLGGLLFAFLLIGGLLLSGTFGRL
jgi:uncharacterized integral membrane protein (TIGR00698 family)